MDAAVGRLVDTLRAVGALDNTLVTRFLLEGKYLLIVFQPAREARGPEGPAR